MSCENGDPLKWEPGVPIFPGKWGPGSPYHRENGDPGPHITRRMGTQGPHFPRNFPNGVPIFPGIFPMGSPIYRENGDRGPHFHGGPQNFMTAGRIKRATKCSHTHTNKTWETAGSYSLLVMDPWPQGYVIYDPCKCVVQ